MTVPDLCFVSAVALSFKLGSSQLSCPNYHIQIAMADDNRSTQELKKFEDDLMSKIEEVVAYHFRQLKESLTAVLHKKTRSMKAPAVEDEKRKLKEDDDDISVEESFASIEAEADVDLVETEANNQLLSFNALYSNSASDAWNEIRIESLTEESKFEAQPELFIHIVPDKTNNILSIIDSGIGMTKADLENNLGTIVRLGTKKITETLAAEAEAGGCACTANFDAVHVFDEMPSIVLAEKEVQPANLQKKGKQSVWFNAGRFVIMFWRTTVFDPGVFTKVIQQIHMKDMQVEDSRVLECDSELGKEAADRRLPKLIQNSDNFLSVSAHGEVITLLKICAANNSSAEPIGVSSGILRSLVGFEGIKWFMIEEGSAPAFVKLCRSRNESVEIRSVEFVQDDRNMRFLSHLPDQEEALVQKIQPLTPILGVFYMFSPATVAAGLNPGLTLPIPRMFPNMMLGAGQFGALAAMPVHAMTQQATRHARAYVRGLLPTTNEQSAATFFSQVMAAIGGKHCWPRRCSCKCLYKP